MVWKLRLRRPNGFDLDGLKGKCSGSRIARITQNVALNEYGRRPECQIGQNRHFLGGELLRMAKF